MQRWEQVTSKFQVLIYKSQVMTRVSNPNEVKLCAPYRADSHLMEIKGMGIYLE